MTTSHPRCDKTRELSMRRKARPRCVWMGRPAGDRAWNNTTEHDHRPKEEARTASWRLTATTRCIPVTQNPLGSRCQGTSPGVHRHPSGVDRVAKTGRRTVRK